MPSGKFIFCQKVMLMPDLSFVDTIVIIDVVFTGVQTVVAVITFFRGNKK